MKIIFEELVRVMLKAIVSKSHQAERAYADV